MDQAFIIINNGDDMRLRPYSEQYKVFIDPVKALNYYNSLFKEGDQFFGPMKLEELLSMKVGIMHTEMADFKRSIMKIITCT